MSSSSLPAENSASTKLIGTLMFYFRSMPSAGSARPSFRPSRPLCASAVRPRMYKYPRFSHPTTSFSLFCTVHTTRVARARPRQDHPQSPRSPVWCIESLRTFPRCKLFFLIRGGIPFAAISPRHIHAYRPPGGSFTLEAHRIHCLRFARFALDRSVLCNRGACSNCGGRQKDCGTTYEESPGKVFLDTLVYQYASAPKSST